MKLLYISPFNDTNSVNGGYAKVANEFKRIFEFYPESVTCVATDEFFKNKEPFVNYDKVLFLIHPNQVMQYHNQIAYLLQNIEKKYLHIFWETEPLPVAWKGIFENSIFNGYVASSKFNKELIEKETKFPTYLLSVPVNEKDYVDFKIDVKEKEIEEVFTVFYIGQYTKRKGFEDAVVSFVNALGDKEDCSLVLKYYPMSSIEIPAEQMVKHLVYSNIIKKEFKAKIYTLEEDLKKEKVYKLYQKSSVLLFPSRGEGFGLPLIESAMIGLPYIYTDGSSLSEFKIFNGYPVKAYKEVSQGMAQYAYERDSEYWIPSMSSLVTNLKLCYGKWKENKKEYYSKFKNEDKLVVKEFGTEKSFQLFGEFLNE